VNARVYDLGGRQVAQLIEGTLAAGAHDLVWNGLDLSGRPAASGLYLLQVEAGGVLRESKLTLLR
jgi:flagellar hook assembly protein FlgD